MNQIVIGDRTVDRGGLSGFQLKIIAMIFMVVDHVNTYFGDVLGLPDWFSWLGRFVAPVFLYLLMEGFIHTSDRKRYLGRLLKGSLIMYAINIIHNILRENYFHPVTGRVEIFRIFSGHNIFWTLFLIMSLFMLLDGIRSRGEGVTLKTVLTGLLLVVLIILAEGGLYLLPIAIACFYFRNDPLKVSGFIAIWSILLLVKSVMGYNSMGNSEETLFQFLTFSSQFMMMTAIPFILMYNGRRGGNGRSWEKGMFYFFYPFHFVVIYILLFLFRI